MARIKLACIGGGSTRAPGTIASLITRGERFQGSQVVLVDAAVVGREGAHPIAQPPPAAKVRGLIEALGACAALTAEAAWSGGRRDAIAAPAARWLFSRLLRDVATRPGVDGDRLLAFDLAELAVAGMVDARLRSTMPGPALFETRVVGQR